MSWASQASSVTTVPSIGDLSHEDIASAVHLNEKNSLPSSVKPLATTLAHHTRDELLSLGCFELPDYDTCRELIRAYGRWIHPTLPMVDLLQLSAVFSDKDSGSASLLLLKAVLMVSYPLVGHDTSRQPALARQVESLVRANAERDPILVLQTLILMTYNETDSQGRNSYYWMRMASKFSARLLADAQVLSDTRPALRATFWSLMARDATVSLAARRPRQCKFEIPASFQKRPAVVKMQTTGFLDYETNSLRYSNVQESLHELCNAIQVTMDSKHSQDSLASVQEPAELLTAWYEHWHERLRSIADQTGEPSFRVHQAVILGYWSLAVVTLHCWNPSHKLEPTPEQSNKSEVVATALNTITSVYLSLYEQNLTQYIPSTAVTALAPAAVAHLMNSTSLDWEVRAISTHKYYLCWQVLRDLSSKYESAGQVMSMMDTLGQGLKDSFDTGTAEQAARLRIWCTDLRSSMGG
ncbi:uncharacterized protein HMPREF1541_09391 [Cyphellophora europaea CBS 101466]|uniref:Transcription factor domain-containing protein n=1 Tax=Cyphellophora europaea (strain CBS 101466) TaxID=1220924 RepID=W2SCB1_CYPE1|nr:uncharacterized protein HMPREF1541_09391 [Cyphellophora europaea CBS 101466]ETN45559.1 hypothetical protein HMPREF1541_09391 [Cyphellophora europaea CBS 101466]